MVRNTPAGTAERTPACLDRWSLSNRRVAKNMAAGLEILLKHATTHARAKSGPFPKRLINFWKRQVVTMASAAPVSFAEGRLAAVVLYNRTTLNVAVRNLPPSRWT